MSIIDRIREMQDEMTQWRRHIHAHPETAFEEYKTADFVAEKLESWGLDVHRGLGKTGVVGSLKAGTSNRAIGLRADLDALDMQELNDFSHRSTHSGKMHACGHDGHTTMLLGAAKYMSETRNFDGTVHFIFQPAEENVAGGRVMIADGLFDKFPVESVYGMHNMPGLPLGSFAVRTGPLRAAADLFEARIIGHGGHGAFPHLATDPVVIAAQVVQGWQSIVSRQTDPMKAAVVSVTQINGGFTTNVIPEDVVMTGTTRAFDDGVQDMIEASMKRILEGICAAHGATCEFTYDRRYAATVNTADETGYAIEAAASVVGLDRVNPDTPAVMGAEDFSWMLRERPGCYLFIGNGTEPGGCHVHNPNYDFKDDNLAIGASYWSKLVERILPAE